MSWIQNTKSRHELELDIASKISGCGRRQFFRYVWTVTTILCCLLINFALRHALFSVGHGLADEFIIFMAETLILLVSASAGFFFTRMLWLHFTKWYPERNGFSGLKK